MSTFAWTEPRIRRATAALLCGRIATGGPVGVGVLVVEPGPGVEALFFGTQPLDRALVTERAADAEGVLYVAAPDAVLARIVRDAGAPDGDPAWADHGRPGYTSFVVVRGDGRAEWVVIANGVSLAN